MASTPRVDRPGKGGVPTVRSLIPYVALLAASLGFARPAPCGDVQGFTTPYRDIEVAAP